MADEAFACFLGYVVGNGCLAGHGTLGWSVNLHDLAVADAIAALVDRLFGLPVYPRPPYNGAQDSHLHSVPLLAWLRELGVAKDRVPDFVWQSRASGVAAFLCGYFSADGWATDDETGRVSIASSRPRLIAEVQALLLALGIPATRRQQTGVGPGKRHTAYILSVVAAGLPAFAHQIGFAVPRRQARLEALLRRWTGKQVFGGMPHLRDKVRALGLSGRVRQLLNNTASLGRPVSPALAARVAALDPSLVAPLGLHGSVPDLLTCVLDRQCEFIAIHEKSKDEIMHPAGFRKTAGLPCEALDAGPSGEMLTLNRLGVLLPDFMGLQTQMPLLHAGVIGVQACDAQGL